MNCLTVITVLFILAFVLILTPMLQLGFYGLLLGTVFLGLLRCDRSCDQACDDMTDD